MDAVRRVLWLFGSGQWDGPTSAALQIAPALQRSGLELACWFHSGGAAVDEFRRVGLNPSLQPRYGSWWRGRAALAAARSLVPEAIHAQSAELAPAALRLAAGLGNVPVFVTVHRTEDPANQRLAKLESCTIIAVSDAIMERLANVYHVPAAKLKVVVDCLDLAQYPRPDFTAPATETVEDGQERTPECAHVVGSWGRLVESKGQRVLLRAVALLVGRGYDVEAVLLGDGPDRAALRDLSRQLGIESRLTFAPLSTSGTLAGLDILVEPSFREGFGLSALQAMALGVPVVASGVGGLFALVRDGETGLMVPPGDAEALATAMARLLDNPRLRRELARRARDRIESDFDAVRVAPRQREIYNKTR